RVLQVRDGQLDLCLTPVLILLQGERYVESRPMLVQIVDPVSRPPGNRAKDAAFLAKRHFEVTIFERLWTVDDLHAPSGKHRLWVAGAERRERRDAGRDAGGDAAKGQIGVDPQARHQVFWSQCF